MPPKYNPSRQPCDDNGNVIIRNARIIHYIGEHDGWNRYILELPADEAHQTGPYEMRRMK